MGLELVYKSGSDPANFHMRKSAVFKQEAKEGDV